MESRTEKAKMHYSFYLLLNLEKENGSELHFSFQTISVHDLKMNSPLDANVLAFPFFSGYPAPIQHLSG